MKKYIYINDEKTEYIVYSTGEIFSEKTNKFLKPRGYDDDYQRVVLFYNNEQYQFAVHRLVASAFLPNPENKPEVNHKNGNKHDNSIENLEWVTKSENILHAFKTGLKHAKCGHHSHLAIYDSEQIKDVCVYLEEGLLTLREISNITGVSFAMIYLIVKHKSWTDISQNYNIDAYYHDRESYTIEQYRQVFQLMNQNKYSLYEISDITGVKYSSLSNILAKKSNPIYNSLYSEIDISNYTGGIIPYRELPEDLKKEAQNLYQHGMKSKYIKRLLSKKYNINEEKIRSYINRHIK
jgi:hypothetical protein